MKDFKYYFTNPDTIIIDQSNYLKNCQKLINLLKTDHFEKVVYSRITKHPYQKRPIQIFEELNLISRQTFNYLISIENLGVWIGATPEKLVDINGTSIKTVSIAGTKVSPKKEWGNKEMNEQKIVTTFIYSVLNSNHCTSIEIDGPKEMNTGVVAHLKTDIRANINFDNWPQIISDLHPTPATCGLPKTKVLTFLQTFEKHDRSFYTGFLGTIKQQSINLFVNLRCMQLTEDYAYLYLGGGITKDSVALDEWNETENKAKTLLRVL